MCKNLCKNLCKMSNEKEIEIEEQKINSENEYESDQEEPEIVKKEPEFQFRLEDDEDDMYACQCGRRGECIECGQEFCTHKGFIECNYYHDVPIGICGKCYNRGTRWYKCRCGRGRDDDDY